MGRFSLFGICLCAMACTPAYGPVEPEDLQSPVDAAPLAESGATEDTMSEALQEALNLSFESPAVSGGFSAPPSGWTTGARGDARSFVYGDPFSATDGVQYLVMAVDSAGRAWVTSPDLAYAEADVDLKYSLALRSDCPSAVLRTYLGEESVDFAVLPTRDDWARLTFAITPDAAQDGEPLWVEIINEASEPCDLQLDDVQIR